MSESRDPMRGVGRRLDEAIADATRTRPLGGGPGTHYGKGAGSGAALRVTPEEDEYFRQRSDHDVKWSSPQDAELHDLRVKLSEARAFAQDLFNILDGASHEFTHVTFDLPAWLRR